MNWTLEKLTTIETFETFDSHHKSFQENLEILDKIVVATWNW